MDLDEKFMRLALKEAEKAGRIGEVPVGAIIVDQNSSILSKAHNLRESKNDPTAHAEILAIKKASNKIKTWRLNTTTLYVTLEPCVMCMGAVINSRVKRVVFGATDQKSGALISNYGIAFDKFLNHNVEFTKSVLEHECSVLLKDFFKKLRTQV